MLYFVTTISLSPRVDCDLLDSRGKGTFIFSTVLCT